MGQVVHIFKKEFKSYFVSPVAYIVIALFLLITGWLFFSPFFLYDQANLRYFFGRLPIIFTFVVPAITMRLFSEELNVGSHETLMTLPVTSVEVVTGKFLAASAFITVMLLPSLSYPIFISFIGDLDWGPVIGGYIGAIFLGSAFSAVGLFASSLTRNQIIAFIIGMAICFLLFLIDKMLFFLPEFLVSAFEYLSADYHFINISKGIIDTRDILYFISICFIGLYGSHLSLQEKN